MTIAARKRILRKYRDAIRYGMARTLWVHAYAPYAEEGEEFLGPGKDWYDYAPATPEAAGKAAEELIKLYESLEFDIVELYAMAITVDTGADYQFDDLIGRGAAPALPGQFGSALADMAMGTDASWFDDHRRFDLRIPSFEIEYDGEELTWSGSADVPLATANPSSDERETSAILEYATATQDTGFTAADLIRDNPVVFRSIAQVKAAAARQVAKGYLEAHGAGWIAVPYERLPGRHIRKRRNGDAISARDCSVDHHEALKQDLETWRALEYVGVHRFEAGEDPVEEPEVVLELRQCDLCPSTIAIKLVPVTP